MSAPIAKCRLLKMSAPIAKCQLLKMSAPIAKCRRPKMSAPIAKCQRPNFLLFGLGGLSTLLSFSVRLKFSFYSFYSFYSFWRCCSSTFWSSSGICSQIRSAYMGGISAVLARLVVPARPVKNVPKCPRPSKCWRPPTFWPFFFIKVKILIRLTSVLSLPFKFVQNHKSCPNSAASLLGL